MIHITPKIPTCAVLLLHHVCVLPLDASWPPPALFAVPLRAWPAHNTRVMLMEDAICMLSSILRIWVSRQCAAVLLHPFCRQECAAETTSSVADNYLCFALLDGFAPSHCATLTNNHVAASDYGKLFKPCVTTYLH